MTWEIRQGDVLEQLRAMPDEAVHCCITSPPYYGLRDYGTGEWEGGSSSCDHIGPLAGGIAASSLGDYGNGLNQGTIEAKVSQRQQRYRSKCRTCGARRVDQQIGLEDTPELFVAKLVEVFAEVKRVLRNDGTLWLNLGDSYAATGGHRSTAGSGLVGTPQHLRGAVQGTRRTPGHKPKDLLGIPWAVAFALRADGWYLRSEIIWAKPSPMPESVTDRPTKAHEQVFLLAKSPRYYYDAAAIREPDKGLDQRRSVHQEESLEPSGGLMPSHRGIRTGEGRNGAGRNKRSVWQVAPRPYPGAHFATFPPKLIEPMVLAGSPGGGLVLDPFAGSGTTLQVAVEHGRSAVGLELNAEYVALAMQRLAGVTPPLFATGEAA